MSHVRLTFPTTHSPLIIALINKHVKTSTNHGATEIEWACLQSKGDLIMKYTHWRSAGIVLCAWVCCACGSNGSLPNGFDANSIPTAPVVAMSLPTAVIATTTGVAATKEPQATVIASPVVVLTPTAALTATLTAEVTSTTILTGTTPPATNSGPATPIPTGSPVPEEVGSSDVASPQTRFLQGQQSIDQATSWMLQGTAATRKGRVPVALTYVAPDSYRITSGPTDIILVAEKVYIRDESGTWQTSDETPKDWEALVVWARWTTSAAKSSLVEVVQIGDANASPDAGGATYRAQVKTNNVVPSLAGFMTYGLSGQTLTEVNVELNMRDADGNTTHIQFDGDISQIDDLGLSIEAPL